MKEAVTKVTDTLTQTANEQRICLFLKKFIDQLWLKSYFKKLNFNIWTEY